MESSIAYEIYKLKVGGITWEGKPMKEFNEMPDNIKNAWAEIDHSYNIIIQASQLKAEYLEGHCKKVSRHIMTYLLEDFRDNFQEDFNEKKKKENKDKDEK